MATKLDIIVIGATGYTGRITCKYLAKHTEQISWAVAGRNETKLNALKKDIGVDVKSFVVDLAKPETLDAVCKQARCVISCAGPFNACGMAVVEACVRNNVHYIDSTGEFTFVRRVAERFHEEAKKRNITLASCCGFDCVPADLGNYVVHREAKGEALQEVKCFYKCKTSGVSSGTATSIAELMNYLTKADLSPTSLNPVGASYKAPLAAPTRLGVWYDRGVRSWTAPFVMAACNERIVRRSNALLGSTATYVESMQTGFFAALGVTAAFYAMGIVMAIRPLRNFLVRRMFPNGVAHGPSEEVKKASSFRCTFCGTTVSGKRITTVLQSSIDMYDVTGVFLVECALSAITLDKAGKLVPGVVTSAAGFGDELVRRSRDAGINITTTVESDAADKKSQ